MPPQGTKHFKSPLAVWMNRVGMTTREFKRRLGDGSASRLASILAQEGFPSLVAAYEIERITEGGVPIEAWMATKKAREVLATLRSRQPEEYRPKIQERREPAEDSE